MPRRAKITIVGAGNVGATAAHWAASKELGDIVLLDIIEGVPQGKALDLLEASPVEGFDCLVTGHNDYEASRGSDILLITAGIPRKPGMSRDELIQVNTRVVREVTENLVRRSPGAILIVVTNPLDPMVHVAWKVSGFPRSRVFGMAGVLDSSRFRTFVALELGVSVEDTHAFVLGGHGDTMVPLPRYSTVAGVPVTELIPKEKLDKIIQRTRDGGAEIINYLKTGSAFFAPGAAVVQMVEAILKDKKRILPCCARLEGEYGERDVFMGVPVLLGAGGIERVIEVKLTEEERAQFHRSADHVRELIKATGL